MIQILFAVLYIFSLISVTYPCSCADVSSEKIGYCASAWISKVKVLSRETDGLGLIISYRIEHIKTYKSPNNKTLPSILNTPSEESACGQIFKVGKQYIFAGSLANNNSLLITFCDWRVPLKYYDEKKLEMKPEWDKFVTESGKC